MINLAYNANRQVFEGVVLSVLSALRFTDAEMHVYILTMDLSKRKPNYLPVTQRQIEALDAVLKERNPLSSAMVLDLTEQFETLMAGGPNDKTEYTPYAFLRLLMDLQPEIPDKILYIDVDIMFHRAPEEIYDIDISEYEYAAAKDHMGQFFITPQYINSGVLLLNMKTIRENALFEKCRKLMREQWMKLPDQSALNILAQKKLYLPRKFNEQRKVKAETVLKHFCKGIRFFPYFYIYNYKQWQREKVHKRLKLFCFDDVYAEYDRLDLIYDFKKEDLVPISKEKKKSCRRVRNRAIDS